MEFLTCDGCEDEYNKQLYTPLPSIETLISRNAKEVSEIFSQVYLRAGWNEFIDSGYKMIEVLSGRTGSADAVVNVATVEFRFRAVVKKEKRKIGVQCSLHKKWRDWVPFWHPWPRHWFF